MVAQGFRGFLDVHSGSYMFLPVLLLHDMSFCVSPGHLNIVRQIFHSGYPFRWNLEFSISGQHDESWHPGAPPNLFAEPGMEPKDCKLVKQLKCEAAWGRDQMGLVMVM